MVGVNVKEAKPREFPFIVSFMRINTANPRPSSDHICTASLITRSHVLLAEHCTNNKVRNETMILAGSNNLNYGRVYRILWWITFNEWAQHRYIHLQNHMNDISIIKVNYCLY
jgi:secreted trypsin-like serine protease